jgi:hypothetical protein
MYIKVGQTLVVGATVGVLEVGVAVGVAVGVTVGAKVAFTRQSVGDGPEQETQATSQNLQPPLLSLYKPSGHSRKLGLGVGAVGTMVGLTLGTAVGTAVGTAEDKSSDSAKLNTECPTE